MAKATRKHQPSSIDRLPTETRELIARLRREGRTITEIHSHLEQLGADVSRSAVGRHVKTLAEIGAEMRQTAEMARFLVEEFGVEADERVGRANMAILQGALMKLLVERPIDEDTGEVVSIDAGEAKSIALALQRVVSSQRLDAERQLKVRAEAKREAAAEAAKAVDKVARTQGGLTKDTVAAIKREILGITDEAA